MNDEENILSPDELKEDYENTLRPKSIDAVSYTHLTLPTMFEV